MPLTSIAFTFRPLTARRPAVALAFTAACILVSAAVECSAQDSNLVESFVFRGQSQAVFRGKLERELDSMISVLKNACGLSDGQIEKLRLAGQVDIQRFLREGERLAIEVRGSQINANRWELQSVLESVAPMRRRIEAGFFVDGSLFAKTLFFVLTPEQLAAPETRSLLRRPFVVRSLTTSSSAAVQLLLNVHKQRQQFEKK